MFSFTPTEKSRFFCTRNHAFSLVWAAVFFFSYPPPKTKDGPKYRQPKNPDQIQSSGSLNLLGQRPIKKKRNKIDGF